MLMRFVLHALQCSYTLHKVKKYTGLPTLIVSIIFILNTYTTISAISC